MKTALVVDDEPEIRTMLRRVLEAERWRVFEAPEGGEAIRICQSGGVDLMVTDIIMPGKEGVETVLQVRNQFPDIKVMAISGGGRISGTRDFLPTAKLLGAHRVLAKPFDPSEFMSVVNELIAEG